MATEDERYRKSSQYRLWSYTPSALQDLRAKTNALAQQQIAPRLSSSSDATAAQSNPAPDFLTADEEQQLLRLFTFELISASDFCGLSTEVRSTAVVFFRRFYVTNSIMTYPPGDLLKTSLFFACKVEGYFNMTGLFVEKLGAKPESILAGEYLLCQGIRFAFDVRHPYRALDGAILEIRRRLGGEQEGRIVKAHARARAVLKFSAAMTDVYFHYTPSQICMAALQMAEPEFVDMLIPGQGTGDDTATGAHSHLRDKIFGAIEGCRRMLEEEPPERQEQYWPLVRVFCSMELMWANVQQPETSKSFKPLRRKLQKCRDPDRVDLVSLQRARREQALNKEKSGGDEDGDDRDVKRRKVEKVDDPFGPPL